MTIVQDQNVLGIEGVGLKPAQLEAEKVEKFVKQRRYTKSEPNNSESNRNCRGASIATPFGNSKANGQDWVYRSFSQKLGRSNRQNRVSATVQESVVAEKPSQPNAWIGKYSKSATTAENPVG